MKLVKEFKFSLMLLAMLFAFTAVTAQSSGNEDLRVKKHTVLAEYEPDLVVSADERLQKKSDRIQLIREKRAIIDTLSITDRKRKRLLKELYRSPFTNHWDKMIAEIESEEEEEDSQ